jgi:hypothetical protein
VAFWLKNITLAAQLMAAQAFAADDSASQSALIKKYKDSYEIIRSLAQDKGLRQQVSQCSRLVEKPKRPGPMAAVEYSSAAGTVNGASARTGGFIQAMAPKLVVNPDSKVPGASGPALYPIPVPMADSATLIAISEIGGVTKAKDGSLNGQAWKGFVDKAEPIEQRLNLPFASTKPDEKFVCGEMQKGAPTQMAKFIAELDERVRFHQRLAREYGQNDYGDSRAGTRDQGSLSGRMGIAQKKFEDEKFFEKNYIEVENTQATVQLVHCSNVKKNLRLFYQAIKDTRASLRDLGKYHEDKGKELAGFSAELKARQRRCVSLESSEEEAQDQTAPAH